MKKRQMIVAAFMLLPLVILAQKEKGNPTKKASPIKNKTAFMANSKIVRFRQLDQRKIYQWGDGQRATPTGRQAGEHTSGYVRVWGDSAVVVPDPFRKKY